MTGALPLTAYAEGTTSLQWAEASPLHPGPHFEGGRTAEPLMVHMMVVVVQGPRWDVLL